MAKAPVSLPQERAEDIRKLMQLPPDAYSRLMAYASGLAAGYEKALEEQKKTA